MISGANHLEVPTTSGVAATVNLGLELRAASPYSVKRAQPLRSTTTFACQHGVSTTLQLRNTQKEISTLQVRQLKYSLRGQKVNLPPLNPRVGY